MPYIKQEDREKWAEGEIEEIADRIDNCGDFNYVVTVLAQSYLEKKGLRYQNINDVVGALEGAKLELYRRIASPYEDSKIVENGDVNVLQGR
jgi:hypothetical protein